MNFFGYKNFISLKVLIHKLLCKKYIYLYSEAPWPSGKKAWEIKDNEWLCCCCFFELCGFLNNTLPIFLVIQKNKINQCCYIVGRILISDFLYIFLASKKNFLTFDIGYTLLPVETSTEYQKTKKCECV